MERLLEFGKAIGTNSHLEKFSMANTNATDKVAMVGWFLKM